MVIDMFFNKSEKVLDLSVGEFIALDMRLNEYIDQWVISELKNGVTENSKIAEIIIFNFKIIYDPNKEGSAMRDFISKRKNIDDKSEYILSRIQDLYIVIATSFPRLFIDYIRGKHTDTLKSLGYIVDDQIVEELEFGWLLHRIQHAIRYNTNLLRKPTSPKS